LWSL